MSADVHRSIEALWRIESGRLIAGLARVTGDVGAAEELAQDALVVALEQWPRTGVPPNPAGWLMTTAKNRAVDLARRRRTYQRKIVAVGRDLESRQHDGESGIDDALDDHIGDDLLRLIFTACHPILSMESRVALTLRCLGGLSTTQIARAFLIPEQTAAQRIVRAKRTLLRNEVAFELPTRAEMDDRLAAVMEVVYLVFNEGYTATAGESWMRPELCEEALRLARILAALVPDRPEAHGFAALLEFQASRIPARTTPSGEPILLPDQDRRLWDRLLIRRGLDSLARAEQLASAPTRAGAPPAALGPYCLQAAIAACHATAVRAEDTDWQRIAALYDVLRHVWSTPVVELNRAVAVARAYGPEKGLAIVDGLVADGALGGYAQLAAVRGDLLEQLERWDEAAAAFTQAAAETRNGREREVFLDRAARLT